MKVIVKNFIISEDIENRELMIMLMRLLETYDMDKPMRIDKQSRKTLELLFSISLPDLKYSPKAIYDMALPYASIRGKFSIPEYLNKADDYTFHKVFHQFSFNDPTSIKGKYLKTLKLVGEYLKKSDSNISCLDQSGDIHDLYSSIPLIIK